MASHSLNTVNEERQAYCTRENDLHTCHTGNEMVSVDADPLAGLEKGF
jgi:hypothetical protein